MALGAIWGVVLMLAHVQRAQFVGELSAILSAGSVREAETALQQLARLPEPPIEVIVAAATSPSRQVAQQAQLSISEMLRKWHCQFRKSNNQAQVSQRIARLAEALNKERNSFLTIDYPWLANTTKSLVRLANSASPRDPASLAVQCESLLLLTNNDAHQLAPANVPVSAVSLAREPNDVFAPPSRLALQSIAVWEERDKSHATESEFIKTPVVNESITHDHQQHGSPPKSNEFNSPPTSGQSPRRPFSEQQDASPLSDHATTSKKVDPATQLQKLSSRDLLTRWLTAYGTPKRQIEVELQRRGFGSLRKDIVRLALSNNTRARVELVYDLLNTPDRVAHAWLILLADDQNAEVRLAAITIMATSNDAELLEKAWQVALHDRDPRIAEVANRLRQRRQ